MKTMRDHLSSLGAVGVLVLGVALAQDQAPQPPATPEVPAGTAAPATSPLVHRPPFSTRRPTTVASPIPSPIRSASPLSPSARSVPAPAAPSTSEGGEPRAKTTTPALKFDNSSSDFLLQAYAEETGKTLLIAPDLPKVTAINLRSQQGAILSREEYLEAIEVTLSMNGIVLEPFGDKFLKVLPRKTIRTEGIKILMEKPDGGHPEKSQVISQMIQLKSIAISEAQKALEGFKRPDGLIQAFERTNSLLVTDTQENINRMLEIVRFIDQPLMVTEEVNVRTIRFAKADDIKKRLEELVAESQKQTQAKEEVKANVSGSPGISRTTTSSSSLLRRPTPPGLTRLGSTTAAKADSTPNESIETLVSDADRGMIRGKVQIISDERSNQLIIITRKENMNFFDKIITVLDIETSPDVKVEVLRLEFADAEEVSTMLNDLIGNATSKKDDKAPTGSAKGSPPGSEANKSTTLAEALAARTASRSSSAEASSSEPGKSKLGALSKDNIKILSDKRTNAIVMMGSVSDLAALKEVIKSMDIQLSQVLIETVVLQVELGDDLTTGMDWVQRGKHTTYVQDPVYGNADDPTEITGYTTRRVVTRDTIFNNGDQLGGGGGSGSSTLESLLGLGTTVASNATDSVSTLLGANTGISYFLKSDKLNIAALIEASKSDTRTKVLSSPVLMTVDNKEATLEATQMRYLYKGVRSSYTGSSNYAEVPDFEQRDIGLTVKITPRINPNGTVVLTIEETFETVGANQQVGDDSYPTVNTRKLQADVSVENMQTVVLGGLVQNEVKTEETGIPILKDIPYIGKYLFGKTSFADTRSELLVFLTPYVLDTSEDLTAEAARRKAALSDDRPWVDYGWSKSTLADPMPSAERTRRTKQRWATEDANYRAEKEYEKLLKAREEQLDKRAKEDAEDAIRQAEEDAKESAGREPEDDGATEAKLRALLGEIQSKKRARQAADERAPVAESPTAIKVTESTEVIKPVSGAEKPAGDGSPAGPKEGGQPLEAEKPWWKLF